MSGGVEVVVRGDALRSLLASDEVAQRLLFVGWQLEREVKLDLHRHGTGRVYKRRGITHQASAAGEPPAADTGLYGASIATQLVSDAQGVAVRVGTNDKRGVWLEKGTRTMQARPHFIPALSRLGSIVRSAK